MGVILGCREESPKSYLTPEDLCKEGRKMGRAVLSLVPLVSGRIVGPRSATAALGASQKALYVD